jgi:hypothetical protein
VAALPESGVGLASGGETALDVFPFAPAAVFLIDLEVQRRRVVEDDLDVEVQKIRHPEVDRLLDCILVRLQEVHRPVQVLQLERGRTLQMHLFREPLLVAVELRAGRAGAIGPHRKQRPLDIEVEFPTAADVRDDLVDPQPPPQLLQT